MVHLLSGRDKEQIRLWLNETEDDEDCESVLGIEDADEEEVDNLEINETDIEGVEEREDDGEGDEVGDMVRNVEMEVDNVEVIDLQVTTDENRGQDLDRREFYIGKDKETRWYLEPFMAQNSRTLRRNIIPNFHKPGPKGHAKNAVSHKDSFECIFDDEIVEKIVSYTNIYIEKIKQNFSRERDSKLTNICEMKSFIGILILAGTMKSSRRNILRMWDTSKGTGVEAIYVTMSQNRFRFLMRCIRFDNVRDRDARREVDKLAAIREIFESVVAKFKNAYNPSDYLSIDEQLVSFRGNCPFRQYIPSKAAKYGIKIYALVSASDFYTSNLEVYVGLQPEGPFRLSNTSMDLVMRLVEPVVGSRRNITADNYFVSLPLAVSLLDDKSLTLVGTIRGNRRVVPKNFLADKDREIHSSIFGYHEKATLVSYTPKKNKAVLALSTMHGIGEIDPSTGNEKKPVIITTYNETKFGVDILDKMCKQYDCSRNSRRWPLTIFFHLLNVGCVNSLNIYRANHNYENVNRHEYLQTLALDLMKPAIHERIMSKVIPKEIQRRGRLLLGIEEEEHPPEPAQRGNATKGRCFKCGRAKDKKVKSTCNKCNNWICPSHSKTVCETCFN